MEEMLRLWGGNIERGRTLLGLTQQQLADRLDVRQSTVARWESGERLPKDIFKIRIAEALHQDVRQLFPLVRGAA